MKSLLGLIALFCLMAAQASANEDVFILETALGGGEAKWECESIRAFAPDGKRIDVKRSDIQALASFPATLLHGQRIGNLQHLYVIYKIWLANGTVAYASQITGGRDNQADCAFKLKPGATLGISPAWYPLGGPQKGGVAYLRLLKRPEFTQPMSFSELDLIRPAIESCVANQRKGWKMAQSEMTETETRRAECVKEARAQCRCDRMASVFCDQCLEGKCPRPIIRNENGPNTKPCDWTRLDTAK